MSRDDDDLRFGDVSNADSETALSEQLIEYVKAGFIAILGGYVLLKILESMVTFDIPLI
jgi:hypothetical protein